MRTTQRAGSTSEPSGCSRKGPEKRRPSSRSPQNSTWIGRDRSVKLGVAGAKASSTSCLPGFRRRSGLKPPHTARPRFRAGLGVCVLTGAFESAATQRELVARGPFSVILSNHVLEHTYHADEVIAAASRLQNEGDHLIIAVPNQEGEPPMGVLLFLPHLHSFTRASLERLGARYGYAVVDDRWVRPPSTGLDVPKISVRAAGGTLGGWRLRAHRGHLSSPSPSPSLAGGA